MINEEKIKVFISSKCGGERINFDQLVNTDSKDKKDVADKAIRTNYDLVRRALKIALEKTGFIRVYVFEDDHPSTSSAQEDYIYKIDHSDICLFLIDNFDVKISEGLLKEINRAEKFKKKSIYLFLNHPNHPQTIIQEHLTGPNSPHYYSVNDIRDFIDQGYNSVINDILEIYQRYCAGRLDYIEKDISSVEITKESFPVETININKQIFKNLGLTKNKIISLVDKPDEKDIQSSNLDRLCLSVLEFLLGEKKFDDIDLVSLLEILKETQSSELHNLVSKRWEAIANFYKGDLETAMKILESVFSKYSEDATISKWLLNSILIDLGNLHSIDNQVKNVIFDFSVQEKLDQQDSPVFFPLIDRFSLSISDDILERNFDLLTSSPYNNRFFNLGYIFGYISNYLFTAIYYGSYTHLVLTLNEIQKVLFDLVQNNSNLLYKIQLMMVSILLGDENVFPKIIGKYKSSLSHSTPKEILDLYKLADTKPTLHQQANWKIMLFREIGYYFSDVDYEIISKEILDFSYEWVGNENPNITLIKNLIEALEFNRDRLSQEKIVRFVIEIFNKKYDHSFDLILNLLRKLNFQVMPQELLHILLSQIKEMLSNEGIKQRYSDIQKLFIKIRKSRDDFSAEIDEIVEKHYPEFYKQEYHLEVFPDDKIPHIQRYLESIKSRNATQGKSGRYVYYADNPYIIIKNIIELSKISLSEELLDNLLKEILNTLFSETQTYSEKINSIELLLFLKKQGSYDSFDWSNYYSNIKQNSAKTEKGNSHFFDQDSALLLQFHLVILRITFGEDCLQEILEILAFINSGSNREIIDSLITLEDFLKVEKDNSAEKLITPIIVQYISAFCFHDNDSVRYRTVRVLYELIDFKYASFVVNRLAKMMEDDDFKVKFAIVNQAHLIKKHSIETFNYITTRAKIDNNYLVRKSIENMSEK